MMSKPDSKKRKANSPIVNREKESRSELNMESNSEPNSWGINPVGAGIGATSGSQTGLLDPESHVDPTSRRSSTASRESYSTVTSKSTQRKEKKTRESVFVTSKPEGAFRDEIVVELQSVDDQVFRGTITLKEARKTIFQDILGFQKEDLSGLFMTYSGGPIVTYKLYSQFNIDQLKLVEFFDLERKVMIRGEERTSILKCKIRGIRSTEGGDGGSYEDTGIRWVKVEGCEYRVDKGQILEWLSFFGEIRSDITEDTHEESEDSENDMPTGNSIYSVRVKLARELPQFMPMYGKRVRLYHRGITKRCTNCFQPHKRNQCKNEKVIWPEYVRRFAETFPEIPGSMYGRWERMTGKQATPPAQHKTFAETQEPSNPTLKEVSQTTNIEPLQDQREKEIRKTAAAPTASQENSDEEEEEEHKTPEEQLSELVSKMLASGISAKTIQKTLEKGSKEGKAKTKALNLGKGRGRGGLRGKPK